MALTGSSHSFLKEFTQQVALTGTSKEALERSKAQAFFNKRLDALTGSLREAATKQDAELSMRLERICIAFERQEYAVTKEDIKRLDKQISESGAAEQSLELVSRPQAYKAHVESLFPGGIPTALPEGDAYITHARRQIQQLGQSQKGMATPHEKAFFDARQDNLRAGVAAFKILQRAALIPPPTQDQGPDKPNLGPDPNSQAAHAENLSAKADEVERTQKALIENSATERYDSGLSLLVTAKQTEMKGLVADMNKSVQQQEKVVADLNKQKPKMFGRKEWEKNVNAAQKQLDSLRKERGELLKQEKTLVARVTEEYRKDNLDLTKERDREVALSKQQTVTQTREKAQEKRREQSRSHKLTR